MENELRRRLTGVELVCQAELTDELLDRAEQVCRLAFRLGTVERLTTRAPATLVSYVAVRGAERYEGIAIWRQLGVETQSWRVGRAFLEALRWLGLPDFHVMVDQEHARAYVAPILIHGGLTAEHAPGLVARLEAELRSGLVDGEEAVARIAADRAHVGRSIGRLATHAPVFAAELFDALIDHITGAVSGSRGPALPRHLRDALDADPHRRRHGLRRIQLPYVAFDPYGGPGPEVVGSDTGPTWTLDQDGRTLTLRPGDMVLVDPCRRLALEGQGRRRILWRHPVLWFGSDGRLIPPEARLPAVATALLPPGWRIRFADGRPAEVHEEHLPLSGPWSRHTASTFDLTGADEVVGEPPPGSGQPRGRWPVATTTGEPKLVGETVDGVSTVDGGPVFRSLPALLVVATGRPVPLWFTPLDGPSRHRLVEPTEVLPTGIPLDWLHAGPVVGSLDVRAGDGRRRSFPFAVAPGLAAEGLDRPLALPEATSVRLRLDPGDFGISSLDVQVPPIVDQVVFSLPRIPDGSLRLDVPRVRWALRRRGSGRLKLADGVIHTDVDRLLQDGASLLVRCGRQAHVHPILCADGEQAQVGRGQQTRDAGGRHQCAFPLAAFTDTLRRHRRAAIELRLNVDGASMVAVTCGDTACRTMRGQSAPPVPPVAAGRVGSASDELADADGLHDHEDESSRRPRHVSTLAGRLEQLDAADQIVTFVLELGEAARRWSGGPSGNEWAAFAEVGDRLWHVESLRYRYFASRTLEDGLVFWARRAAHTVRPLTPVQREVIELWSMQRLPPLERTDAWRQARWVWSCVPSKPRGWSGVDWLPAALLFHFLVLAGGDERSVPAVSEIVDLLREPASELVAFLLEAARIRRWPQPVTLTADEPPSDDNGPITIPAGGPTGDAPSGPPPLTSLDQVELRLDGRLLILDTVGPVAPPDLRLSTPEGHARALLFPDLDAGDLVFTLPPDLAGAHELSIVNTAAVPVTPNPGAAVDLPLDSHPPNPPAEGQARQLDQLSVLRRHLLVSAIARSVESQRVSEAPIEDLFDDELSAASSLLVYANSCSDGDVANRVGIAALSMAMLYPGLLATSVEERRLQGKASVLWASLAPREAAKWRPLGWRNSARFSAGTDRYDDIVAFARHRHQFIEGDGRRPSTARYELHRSTVPDRRVPWTVAALDRHNLDRTFVNLVVATYAALSIDAVSPEATRLLVAAHHTGPRVTTEAVLVGIALYLASQGH